MSMEERCIMKTIIRLAAVMFLIFSIAVLITSG